MGVGVLPKQAETEGWHGPYCVLEKSSMFPKTQIHAPKTNQTMEFSSVFPAQ